MAFWKDSAKNTRLLDNFAVATSQDSGGGGSNQREFYELEYGVVLDIVLDENHPTYKTKENRHKVIDTERWPKDCKDRSPSEGDLDYTWIGRALVRLAVSERRTEKDQLHWAYPMESNMSEWPLINEIVVVVKHGDQLYYTKKLNYHNWANNNLDFGINRDISGKENKELYSTSDYTGRGKSLTSWTGTKSFNGFAGKYYIANNKIRTIKRWEGDLLFESRHGQTIHLTSYDKTRGNDVGDPKLPDYKDDGNPMIIIRNRQRQLLDVGETLSLHDSPNPATVVGTVQEKNVGGYLHENINHDGSSIYITCGLTVSEWVTTCYKRMFHDDKDEEVAKFKGPSSFKYPKPLKDEMIIINSDRLIFSARYGETFHYSKKRYGIVTDSEYTVDAHDQIVMTTHVKTVFNSPAIYLGEIDNTNEPVLLGQTTVNWLYELCDWLITHTHWHHHIHIDNTDIGDGNPVEVGHEDPHKTQKPVQLKKLEMMRDTLHTLMSRRVFVTGGGFATGQDGEFITGGTTPVKITIDNKNKTGGRDDVASPNGIPQSPPTLASSPSTTGTPGTFKGKSYRMSSEEASAIYGGAIAAAFGPGGVASDSPAGADPSATPQSDQQKVQALQQLPQAQQAAAAKGSGCGGRSATQTGIYTPPAGQIPVTSSAEVAMWNDRETLLTAAGILEADHNPPPNINVDDWKQVVSDFV